MFYGRYLSYLANLCLPIILIKKKKKCIQRRITLKQLQKN